ncbi:MAG: DUF3050 domain-containing protein [Scytonema sp. CRU_2_7]|nr:DUF3050 domain-containing protein [Scytonema sp. CRU_2_7]
MSDLYSQLMECIYPLKKELVNHPIYTDIHDLYSLQIFMESHIFAVWDLCV